MKNIEIELKYKIDDHQKALEAVNNLNADFVKESYCIDTYYIIPNNPSGSKYLRIREQDDNVELDFHIATSDTHTEEWETEIKSASVMSVILQYLDYKVDVVIDKIRKTYIYKSSEIVVDKVKDLGFFLEIESPSIEELTEIAKELSLKESQVIRGSGYSDLLRKVKNG